MLTSIFMSRELLAACDRLAAVRTHGNRSRLIRELIREELRRIGEVPPD